VQALALQPDGKVVVGGKFDESGRAWQELTDSLSVITLWPLGRRDGLCRLNEDGSLDTSFVNHEFTEVTALAVRDGVIGVGGIQEVAIFWAYLTHSAASNQVTTATTSVTSRRCRAFIGGRSSNTSVAKSFVLDAEPGSAAAHGWHSPSVAVMHQ